MDLKLKRTAYRPDGIFGVLEDEGGARIAVTLEHAYISGPYSLCLSKIPAGTYTCVRGQHQLHSGPIQTFEVTGVPHHSGILFHIGNYNTDSDGCILLGEEMQVADNGMHFINLSRKTWTNFMDLQDGLQSFILVVE